MRFRAAGAELSQVRHAAFAVILGLLAIVIAGVGTAKGQNPPPAEKPAADSLSGKYEGVAKNAKAAETRLTLELVHEKGKVSGRLVTPEGPAAITDGTFADNKLSLKFGEGDKVSTLTAQLQGDKLAGDWNSGGQKQAVEFKRTPAETAATASVAPSAASLSGEWDGMADTQGQAFPFALNLKIDGEKVTGESNSSLGQASISNGTFKDGKLVFQLESQGGVIYMSAVLKDGGLVGEYDYAGQAQGRWVAKKKTP
jgi:hypothetical protein